MKTIRITIFFVAALILVLGTSPLINAQDSFPGNKDFDSGPDPIGIGKNATTEYRFTIDLDANFDNTAIVKDVVPAEFDVTGLLVSCGSAATKAPGKSEGKGNPYKLHPDIIIWNLDGCDSSISQSLEVTIQTDENPGHAKRGIDFFEPTECGPLYLNDGAVIIDGETFEPTEPSNSLFVATCLDESDPDCVDADNDGWSVDCGDCDDSDEAINPGAVEICSDEIDNNCDGYINEDCSSPAIPG